LHAGPRAEPLRLDPISPQTLIACVRAFNAAPAEIDQRSQ